MGFLNNSGNLPIAFAHRGGALEAPENTKKAFQNAIDLGYRYLETDVVSTKDNVLVLFHDKKATRLTGKRSKISKMTWEELSKLRVGGEPIPRADKIFKEFKEQYNVFWNIDPKDSESIPLLVVLLRKLEMEDRVCIGSFYGWRQKRLQRLMSGDVVISAGILKVLRVYLATFFSVFSKQKSKPKLNSRFSCLQVPPWLKIGSLKFSVVTKKFVEAAHAKGLKVHVWTINDKDEMNRLLDLGVDGIMTDVPSTLKEVYIHRNLWATV